VLSVKYFGATQDTLPRTEGAEDAPPPEHAERSDPKTANATRIGLCL
jgi:hypothetical protein